jgi:nitrite transporter
MYQKTIDQFAELAANKARALREDPIAFLVASAMAGAYIGIGIILIFSLGQSVEASVRSLVMGASFGIALTLVVFAGSELFTGHTMFMTFGLLDGRIRLRSLALSWVLTWIGNLAGAALLATLFVLGGGGAILKQGADLLFNVAAAKMNAPALQLFARAILCNWLVCLALWASARATSDAAKCILIFWCLFAFIASGFEHSVANMTVFSIALLSDHPGSIGLMGVGHNLLWVTLGNALAGALFVAVGYWRANGSQLLARRRAAALAPVPAE